MQSHGFNAISDLPVRVRMGPEFVGVFHIIRGQLLNLPYDGQGYLRGPTSPRHSEKLQDSKNSASLSVIRRYPEDATSRL